MKIILIVLSFFFIGCGSVPTTPETSGGGVVHDQTVYKRDMEVCFGNTCSEGVLVVPRATVYKFSVKAKGDLDLFTFSTCHREEVAEDAGSGGWFGSGEKYSGTYTPIKGLEDIYACPAYVGGYNKENENSWAFIDFETPEAKLPATLNCNGKVTKANGVSVCQSKAGLIQQIEFQVPVTIEFEAAKCKMPKPQDDKVWQFEMPVGECVFAFFSEDGQVHRMTLLGYQKILIRGE